METPTAGAFNDPVESDLAEVRKLCFDEGCVSVKCRIGHTGTQHQHSCFPLSVFLCFSPFEEDMPETLPWEACQAWDLLQEAGGASYAKLCLRLIFGTAADYVDWNPQSINLFFNREPDMLNSGEAASQSPWMMNNCLIAQQLLRVVKKKFSSRRAGACDDTKYTGLMAQTLCHIASRLQTLNEKCAFCDEPNINSQSMLQPSACTLPLCTSSMCEGAAILRTCPEVLDLLVETTTLAAINARACKTFDPFPAVHLDLKDKHSELILDPAKKSKHIELAREHLKMAQNWRNHLSSGLLNWLCNSNRTYLALLPRKLQLQQIKTVRQFVMLSAPPDKQRQFEHLKAQGGSTFAWYHSQSENWHRIFRHGLYMTDGLSMTTDAAVHLAQRLELPTRLCMYALDYHDNDKNQSENWLLDKGKAFLAENHHLDVAGGPFICLSPSSCHKALESVDNPKSLQVMVLCEVAKAGLDCKSNTNWVATEESVVTRLLFAFCSDASPGNVSTQSPDFDQTVRDCLKNFKNWREFQEPISCLRDILEGGFEGYLFTPNTWPAERTMMLRATSKKIRDAIGDKYLLPGRMSTATVVEDNFARTNFARTVTDAGEDISDICWPKSRPDAWYTLNKISAMASSDWLTKIDLSHSGLRITVEMSAFLGRVLQQSLRQSLIHLNLANCHIGPFGAQAILEAMQNDTNEGVDDKVVRNFSSLSYLNLSGVFYFLLYAFPPPLQRT